MTGPDSISSGSSHPLDTAEELPESQTGSPTDESARIPSRDKGKGRALEPEPPPETTPEAEHLSETVLEAGPLHVAESKAEAEPATDWELEFAKQQSLLEGTTAEEFLGFSSPQNRQQPETGGASSSSAASRSSSERTVSFNSTKSDARIVQGNVIRRNASSAPETTASTKPTAQKPPAQPAKAAGNSSSLFGMLRKPRSSTQTAAKSTSSISEAGSSASRFFRDTLTRVGVIQETPEARQEREQYAANKRSRIAVFNGNADSIAVYIAHADPTAKSKQDGWNAVHVVALSKNPDLATLQLLIDRSVKLSGSDPRDAAQRLLFEKDNRGNTPLHLAFLARGAAAKTGNQQRKATLDDLIEQMKQWAPSAMSERNNNNFIPENMGGIGYREPSHPDGALDPENL